MMLRRYHQVEKPKVEPKEEKKEQVVEEPKVEPKPKKSNKK